MQPSSLGTSPEQANRRWVIRSLVLFLLVSLLFPMVLIGLAGAGGDANGWLVGVLVVAMVLAMALGSTWMMRMWVDRSAAESAARVAGVRSGWPGLPARPTPPLGPPPPLPQPPPPPPPVGPSGDPRSTPR
jgi:hypothetical protein